MTGTLAQYANTMAYYDVQGIVKMYVRKWMERHGECIGTWEEVESIANEAFMIAISDPNYEAHRSTFNTYVGKRIWYKFLDNMKFKAQRDERIPTEEATFDEISEPSQSSFVVDDFLSKLSEDARTVAELVLDSPMDIRLTLAKYEKPSPKTLRKAVIGFLKDIGWAMERIVESFDEVSEALRG